MFSLWMTQLSAQSPSFPNSMYVKRLVTNYHMDISKYSPLDLGNYRGGFELAYGKNMGRFLNVVFPFKTTVYNVPEQTDNGRYISLGGQLQAHHNIGNVFSPYVFAGAGVIIMTGEEGAAQVPMGAGVNIKINQNLSINIQTEYRMSIDAPQNHYQHGLGLAFNFGGMIEEIPTPEPVVEIPIADRDGDKIIDSEDQCPDIAGLLAFNGCPDSDGDGISDQTDACPDLAGTKEFRGCPDTDGDGFSDIDDDCPDQPGTDNGCPPADSDGDGVVDAIDKCPQIKGTVKGCPDSDDDGVADVEDKCPNSPGPINTKGCPDSDDDGLDDGKDLCPNKPGPLSNQGCPGIAAEDKATLEFAMQAVNFQTGSDQLTFESFAVLDQIAGIIQRYPEYKLAINGHTDSVGDALNNLTLSQSRAETCRDYLISKGIATDRMLPKGFGEDKPRVTNDTPEGRSMNRRVEFDMRME